MKRREVLKGLSTVAGSSLFPASALSIFSQQPAQQSECPTRCIDSQGKIRRRVVIVLAAIVDRRWGAQPAAIP